MTVWVVWATGEDGDALEGVFSTLDAARVYVKANPGCKWAYPAIAECVVDGEVINEDVDYERT